MTKAYNIRFPSINNYNENREKVDRILNEEAGGIIIALESLPPIYPNILLSDSTASKLRALGVILQENN
jgi:hypothetical protein